MSVSFSSAVFSTLIVVDVTRNHFHSFGSSRKQLSVQQLIHIYETSQIHCVNGFSLKTHADAIEPSQILNVIKVSEKLRLISPLFAAFETPVATVEAAASAPTCTSAKRSEGPQRLAAFVNHVQLLPDAEEAFHILILI